MKKIFFVLALACIAVVFITAETISFDKDNSVTIAIPPGWKAAQGRGTPLAEMGKTFDLRLTAPSNEKAMLTITTGKSQTGKPLDKKQLDALTKAIVTEYLKGSVEKKASFVELPINGGQGKYSIFTDASLVNKTPGMDDYKYAVLFLVNYANGCFVYATGLTDDSSGAGFQNMVKSISSIEPFLAAIIQTPPVQIKTNNQGTLIGNAINKTKLLIPSKNLKKNLVGGKDNPGYFYFTDTKVGINLSGWFEPVEKFKYSSAREYWNADFGKVPPDAEYRKVEDWDILLYEMTAPEGFYGICSAHLRVNLVKEDVWIDLHLSKLERKSRTTLHDELVEYLKTLRIQN